MRKITFLLTLALLCCSQAWAQFAPSSSMTYKIKQSGTEKYLDLSGTGLAKVSETVASIVTFEEQNGEWAIKDLSDEKYLGLNGSWNSQANANEAYYWTFTAVDGETDTYTIRRDAAEGNYIGIDTDLCLYTNKPSQNKASFVVVAYKELAEAQEELLLPSYKQQLADLFAQASVGTGFGQVAQSAYDVAQPVVNNDNATFSQVSQALDALRTSALHNLSGRHFRFKSTALDLYISLNATNDHMHAEAESSTDPRQIWTLELQEGKLYMKNLYTATYALNVPGGQGNTGEVGAFVSADNFTYTKQSGEYGSDEATWNLFVQGTQMNCEGSANNLGNINYWFGDNAHWYVYEVTSTEEELATLVSNYTNSIALPAAKASLQTLYSELDGQNGYGFTLETDADEVIWPGEYTGSWQDHAITYPFKYETVFTDAEAALTSDDLATVQSALSELQKYQTLKNNYGALVSVTYTQKKEWGTLISPTNTEKGGLTFYECTGEQDGTLTMNEAAAVKGNTPYLVTGPLGRKVQFIGYNLKEENPFYTSILHGVYEDTPAPVGSYVLQEHDGRLAFYLVGETTQPTVGAYRCYIQLPAASQAKVLYFDGATAIEAATAEQAAAQQAYDLSGRRVKAAAKGLYIVGGKKIIK